MAGHSFQCRPLGYFAITENCRKGFIPPDLSANKVSVKSHSIIFPAFLNLTEYRKYKFFLRQLRLKLTGWILKRVFIGESHEDCVAQNESDQSDRWIPTKRKASNWEKSIFKFLKCLRKGEYTRVGRVSCDSTSVSLYFSFIYFEKVTLK